MNIRDLLINKCIKIKLVKSTEILESHYSYSIGVNCLTKFIYYFLLTQFTLFFVATEIIMYDSSSVSSSHELRLPCRSEFVL